MTGSGNDPLQNKLRKYESILVISGLGVVAFGLWSIVRAAIYYFLNPLQVSDYLNNSDLKEIKAIGDAGGVSFITDNMDKVLMTMIFVILVADLLLRLYVGMSARAYGRGRRRRGFFIVIVWIMAFFMAVSIVMTMETFLEPIIRVIQAGTADAFESSAKRGDHAASVSLIVDLTSLLVLVELGISSIKVKSLRKKLGIVPDRKWRKKKKESQDLSEDLSLELENSLANIMGE